MLLYINHQVRLLFHFWKQIWKYCTALIKVCFFFLVFSNLIQFICNLLWYVWLLIFWIVCHIFASVQTSFNTPISTFSDKIDWKWIKFILRCYKIGHRLYNAPMDRTIVSLTMWYYMASKAVHIRWLQFKSLVAYKLKIIG